MHIQISFHRENPYFIIDKNTYNYVREMKQNWSNLSYIHNQKRYGSKRESSRHTW